MDIQREVARQIGSDMQAIGPERLFRIPTPENTVEHNGERVSAAWFVEWLEMAREEGKQFAKPAAYTAGNLLACPAIQKLLEGAPEGQQDNTAYTLALVYRAGRAAVCPRLCEL
ncbi:hypothetical protein JQN58_17930 [Aneurinibacillus sp. BA2021]|nr:hypothetical protein [Aneurinibacillus sp. BA2021]